VIEHGGPYPGSEGLDLRFRTPGLVISQSVAVSKELILSEIRRLAKENGEPPGQKRFHRETEIVEHDWRGKYWARWGDAITEAGFVPNEWGIGYDDEAKLASLAGFISELGRFPTESELGMRHHADASFPSQSVWRRFGTQQKRIAMLIDRYRDDPAFANVVAICEPLVTEQVTNESVAPRDPELDGEVYLLKSGRYYKIGRTGDIGRRRYDIALQLPEKHTLVHSIRTDDPVGIEAYWHKRFADRRANGGWFSLSAVDVRVFKRRKFM